MKPRWFRSVKGRHIGWEIYSWRVFSIIISFGSVEIEFTKWPKSQSMGKRGKTGLNSR